MRRGFFFFLWIALLPLGTTPAQPLRTLEGKFSLSGELQDQKDLLNRLDLRIYDNLSDLTLRALLVDHRPDGDTALRAGLYHHASGSRILYGPLYESGLATRIHQPWSKGIPYAELHTARSGEINTTASPTAEESLHIQTAWAGEAPIGILGSFSRSESEKIIAGLGFQGKGSNASKMLLEGTYITRPLPERTADSWFSDEPPLPERRLNIGGIRGFLRTHAFSIGGDLAYSVAESQGSGSYGNFAAGIDMLPWRFDLALEGSDGLFFSGEGSQAERGYRVGGKLERIVSNNGLWQLEGLFGAPTPEAPVQNSAFSLYYRSRPKARNTHPYVSNARIAAERERTTAALCNDLAEASAVIRWRFLRLALGGRVDFRRPLLPGMKDPLAVPLTGGGLLVTENAINGDISARIGMFELGGKAARKETTETEAEWTASVSAAIAGSKGRLGVDFSLPTTGHPWVFGITWRTDLRFAYQGPSTPTP